MAASVSFHFSNQFDKVPAIKALIEYFYSCEGLARYFFVFFLSSYFCLSHFSSVAHRLVEQNTDAILDNPKKSENKGHQSQEEVEETVTKRNIHIYKIQIQK